MVAIEFNLVHFSFGTDKTERKKKTKNCRWILFCFYSRISSFFFSLHFLRTFTRRLILFLSFFSLFSNEICFVGLSCCFCYKSCMEQLTVTFSSYVTLLQSFSFYIIFFLSFFFLIKKNERTRAIPILFCLCKHFKNFHSCLVSFSVCDRAQVENKQTTESTSEYSNRRNKKKEKKQWNEWQTTESRNKKRNKKKQNW